MEELRKVKSAGFGQTAAPTHSFRHDYSMPSRDRPHGFLHSTSPPSLSYSVAQRQVKGEDVLFVLEDLASIFPQRKGLGKWSMYCVCDGHGGTRAAKFVRSRLGPTLSEFLPLGDPPPFDQPEGEQFAESVRSALVEAFLSLNEAFTLEDGGSAGTTISVALVCGWMLTMANVGDSEVFLDVNAKVIEMTCCHKVNDHLEEQERLRAAGINIRQLSKRRRYGPSMDGEAGVGPLRAWPGGIAMSRSLGDIDCGPHILPMPHIRQVIIPPCGGRMILASDGLWDHISGSKACQMIHSSRLPRTADSLMNNALAASGGRRLSDDTSILVLDILPVGHGDFSDPPKKCVLPKKFMVFSFSRFARRVIGKKPQGTKEETTNWLYADVDGLVDYPDLLGKKVRDKLTRQSDLTRSSSFEKIEQVGYGEPDRSESISGSDTWDVCQTSWDCAFGERSVWEFDERDILDTAQNYTTSNTHTPKKSGPQISVVLARDSHKSSFCKSEPHAESCTDNSTDIADSEDWEGATLVPG